MKLTEPESKLILEAREVLHKYLSQKRVLSSWDILNDYLTLTMTNRDREEFHVLYLDRKNRLIEDVTLHIGTVDHVPVYPREICRQALLLNASALILVHNHPSGCTQPSSFDISMTKTIVKACKVLGLTVHDHLIVGAADTQPYSMKSHGDM